MEAETTERFMDAQTVVTDEGETTSEDFGAVLAKCGSCKEALHTRSPRLLSCLHTFCSQCVNSLERGENGQITCPVCRQVSLVSNIIDNIFLPDIHVVNGQSSLAAAAGNDGSLPVTHPCTGCEENVTASFYCVECTEWLCEPCAQAHRRVKVTKDHNVESVEKMQLTRSIGGNSGTLKRRGMMCPVHPQEQLKLYCDTCSRLTCRDCQLVEHKDHKYQFVQEAAQSCRELLLTLLSKVKEKQAHIHNAKNLIDRRHKEITEKERAVSNEVKAFVMTLIREINMKGRQLIGELQAICTAKRRQLEQKNTEVGLLSDNLEHGLKFAEHLLAHADDASLLYSRRTLAHQLSAILRTRCEVPNPYHVIDLRFTGNQSLSTSMSKLGCIIVDGYQYNQRAVNTATIASGSNSTITSHSSGSTGHSNSAASAAATKHLTNEQKLMLMMRLNQQQQQQQQKVGQVASTAIKSVVSHDFYSSCGVVGTHRMGNMPNQSSNISSSNQHQSLGYMGQSTPSGRHSANASLYISPQNSTNVSTSAYIPGQISLAQLQEERLRRERREQRQSADMVSTTLPPIVIQPNEMRSPEADLFPNGMNPFSGQSTSPGEAVRESAVTKLESNSYGPLLLTANSIKKEKKMFDYDVETKTLDSSSAGLNVVRSRTPTPHIESTCQELSSGDSPLSDAIPVTTGVEPVVNSNQFSLGDPINFSSLSNPDEMFLMASADANESKNDEASDDWNAVNVSTSDANGTLNELGLEAEARPPVTTTEIVTVSQTSSRNAEDRNDDYCAVCRNGGDLLCCDRCPRVYHLKCHVPVYSSFPSQNTTWLCTLCSVSDEKLQLDSPEANRSIVVGTKRRLGGCGLSDRELQVCEHLLLELYVHEQSLAFHEPVSKSIPNYYKIITNPMDLGTIRSRLSKSNFNHYQSVEDFVADVRLVFSNCATFNPPDTEVGNCGRAVEEFFETRVRQLLPFIEMRANTPASDLSDSASRLGSKGTKRRRLNNSKSKGSSHGSGDCDELSLDGMPEKEHLPCDNPTENSV